MSSLFHYTGVVVWVIIGFIAVSVFFVVFWTLWDRDISPSLANLRFAVFGKPKHQGGVTPDASALNTISDGLPYGKLV